MTRLPLKSSVWPLIILLLVVGGCARLATVDRTALKAQSLSELESQLQNRRAELDLFRLMGPFFVARQNNIALSISTYPPVSADLYLASHKAPAPLVIFLHGLNNYKESHAVQAMHIASWGLHCLTLQLPNNGPWVDNGKILGKVVDHLVRQPKLFNGRVDVNRIILVGHSFGAQAAAIALAEGARAAGGILLDPAVSDYGVPQYLRKIAHPVLVIGADQRVSSATNREYYSRFIRGASEVSVLGAAHEDAQDPSGSSLFANEDTHITFVSAITAGLLSLSMGQRFDYAWASYVEGLNNGRLIDPKRQ